MQRLRELEITVIADLLSLRRSVVARRLSDPAFPVLFAEYARAFARRYPWIRHFTPVNEIFVAANFSALKGWWNECETSDRAFVRAMRNLCMAHELAVEAISPSGPTRSSCRANRSSTSTPGPGAQMNAERMNGLAHLSLDLTTGHELAPGMARFLNEHGVTSNDLSFFRERRAAGQRLARRGLPSHVRASHRISRARHRDACDADGTSPARDAYHERYRLPIFPAGRTASDLAVDWLDRQWSDILAPRVQDPGDGLHLVFADRSDRLASERRDSPLHAGCLHLSRAHGVLGSGPAPVPSGRDRRALDSGADLARTRERLG
jgi:hypothetical protein